MLKKLISIALIVSLTPAISLAKTLVYSKDAPAPIGAYSQAITHNGFTYISGQIPIDPKTGNLVTGDFKSQLLQALNNVSNIAKAANGDINDMVKVTIYLQNMENYPIVNEVTSEYFKKPYPARSVIGVKELPKGASVEVEAIMAE